MRKQLSVVGGFFLPLLDAVSSHFNCIFSIFNHFPFSFSLCFSEEIKGTCIKVSLHSLVILSSVRMYRIQLNIAKVFIRDYYITILQLNILVPKIKVGLHFRKKQNMTRGGHIAEIEEIIWNSTSCFFLILSIISKAGYKEGNC